MYGDRCATNGYSATGTPGGQGLGAFVPSRKLAIYKRRVCEIGVNGKNG